MLVFRQLFDPPSSTYTYLLADGGNGAAVIIDPVFEQVRRDAALIEELGLRLAYALETHVHADHVTGAWLLKQRTGCRIALAANSGAEGADRYLVQDDVVAFGDRNLQVRQTPGPYQWLPDLCARRPQHGVHRRLSVCQRHRADRFPARRPARDVPLDPPTDLHLAGFVPALSRARLPRTDGHQRPRGKAVQPAPGRRNRGRRFYRLHEKPAPGPPQESSMWQCPPI